MHRVNLLLQVLTISLSNYKRIAHLCSSMDARQKGKTAVAPTLATINLQFDKTAASSTESDQLQDALIVALFVVSERLMIVKGKTTLGARLESRDANAGLGDMWNEMRLITNKSHGKQSVTASRSKDTSAYKPLLISKSGQEPLLPQGLLKVSSSPQENINANSNTESFSSSSSNGNIAAINLPAPSSREVSAILKKQSSCTSVHSFESVAASSAAGSNSIYLPSEILSLIFKCLKHSQKDLATIVLVSKFWNIVGTRLLYDAPQIGSMSSFQMFLNTLTNACNTFPGRQQLSSISGEPLYIVNGAMKPSIWSYHEFCNALYFLPSDDGSLYDKMPYNSEIINEVHSILFRILTHDRGIDLLAGHPLFLHLLNICPNLVSIREKSRLDTPSKLLSREGGSRNRRGGGGNSSSNSFRPLPDSNMSYSWVFSDFNLAQVLLATNRVRRLCRVFIGERLYQPPSVLKSDASVGADMKTLVATIQRISDSVLFLMELFEESQDNCVWDSFCRNPIQSKNVNTQNIKILEKAQAIVMVRCRNFLNALSSTLLLQVQYVTVSSQRLLDTYCLMYYRALSLANSLNTKLILLTLRKVAAEVVKTTKAAATGSKNNITGRADGHNIIVFSDQITPLIKIMQIMHALRQRVPVTLHRNRDQPDERSTTLEVDQEIEEDINPETESDVDGDDVNDHQDVLNHPIPSSSSSSSSAPAAAVLPTNSSINVVLPGQVIPSSFTTSDFRDGEVQSIIHLMEEGSPELGESVGDGSEYLPLLLPDNSSSSSTGLIGNESNPPDLTHSSSISSLGITPELHRMRITTTNDLELGEIIPLPGAGHQQISVAPQTDGPSSSTASSTSSLDVIARTMLGVASDRSRGDASNIALASDLRSPLSSSSSSTSSLRSTFRKGTKSATLAAHNCSNPNCSSSLHRAASKWEKMTTTDMREVFISLAPSNVNDETIEYVEHLLETIELEVVDDETEELDRVLDWIRDVIDWQRANKQLDPVKDFLRKSMMKIDSLREIQRRFGVRFLD